MHVTLDLGSVALKLSFVKKTPDSTTQFQPVRVSHSAIQRKRLEIFQLHAMKPQTIYEFEYGNFRIESVLCSITWSVELNTILVEKLVCRTNYNSV